MPEQTYDYLIAPKASFDATADAVRALNGTNSAITWGQDGFAEAIGNERRYGYADIVQGARFTDASVTLEEEDVKRLKPWSFAYDTALQSISAPYVVMFNAVSGGDNGDHVFYNCSNLTDVYLPSFRSAGSGGYQFSYCTSLQTINLPFANIGTYMFSNCTNLETAVMGQLRTASARMNQNAFRDDTKLTTVDLNGVTSIYNAEFYNCSKLSTLILRNKNAIMALGNTNCFTNTPFASGKAGGTIYIPKTFYDALGTGTNDYQSATNWSTIYGYGTITWEKIEGSYYETHYADGTEVTIGDGVNLLANSEHFDPTKEPYLNSNTVASSSTIDSESYYHCSGQYYIQVDLPLLTVGTAYILSFELYRTNAQDVFWTENGIISTLSKNTANAWTRYSIQLLGYTPQKTRSIKIQINNTSATGSSAYIAAFRHFKLEKGTEDTAWTAAPTT